MGYINLILGTVIVVLVSILWRFIVLIPWRIYSTTKKIQKQGIKGPKFGFNELKSLRMAAWSMELDINSHDTICKVLPHYHKWINQYGGTFLFWDVAGGLTPTICITNVEQVKQILANKFSFTKRIVSTYVLALLGKGLVFTEGLDFVRHKKVVSPAFTMEKLKLMTKKMADCTLSMLDNWHKVIQADGQDKSIEVSRYFQELTADIISHAAFGSCYLEGKEVFSAQNELQILTLAALNTAHNQIPGFNYLPTRLNRKGWELDRKIKKVLTNMINSRLKSKNSSYGNDLLGILVESMKKQDDMKLNVNEIIDECKTFYFAGHETTSHLLTWTMFLLSTNPEWQEKLREEVVRECGMEVPNADNLIKFKFVTMVLLESLRLYPPVLTLDRMAAEDINLGSIMIPKGAVVSIPVPVVHQQKELWGENADKFDPLRFENGVANASTQPNAMLAFSMGPRACIGQNFAMLEAKMTIAMVLQRFSFSLSKDYKHMPTQMLTLQPQYGLPIVLKPLVA